MPFCSMLYNDLLQRTKPSTYFHSLLVTGKFQQRTKLFAHSNAMPFFLVYTISNKKQIQLCVFTRRFLHYLQSSTKSVRHITRKYAFYSHIRIIFFFLLSYTHFTLITDYYWETLISIHPWNNRSSRYETDACLGPPHPCSGDRIAARAYPLRGTRSRFDQNKWTRIDRGWGDHMLAPLSP